ncbi:hypothetical protein CSH63_27270 [Micromonospora tulbaghiae]|uniref:Uncharacterized protein n=1 Tax=Micromonospora tulbaghiae TaxID=479978 RepID=A0A386WSY3_9ACTN|nr:hypothetical protein [Micromonospora tulbaghiae]AYF31073.1 hypothetical protein CSH63_27270 [Micromonospora tulbaghiae]
MLDPQLAERLRSAAAAWSASAKSSSAAPLSVERRRDNYRRQNGTRASGQLTPRQRRRADHKANRAAVRRA